MKRNLPSSFSRIMPVFYALDTEGAQIARLLSVPEARHLSTLVRRYHFEERAPTYGSRKVIQRFRACEEEHVPAGSIVRQMSTALGGWIGEEMGSWCEQRGFTSPFVPPLAFNDHLLLWYPKGDVGLGAHRDHSKYRNLIVSLTLCGTSRFNLHDHPDAPPYRSFRVGPGCAVVMCAPGFKGLDIRPYHSITEVTEERIALILKQKGA
jgi:hypothetical protein